MSRRKVESMSFLYGNNTQSDLTAFHAAITASLKATGRVPPELADIFVAVPTAANPDGSPRFMIYTIEDEPARPSTLPRSEGPDAHDVRNDTPPCKGARPEPARSLHP